MKEIQIEKKYYITELPSNYKDYKKRNIEQGYLSVNEDKKIRRVDDKYFLISKSFGDLIRTKEEKEITRDVYINLLAMVESNLITKTRYYIPVCKDKKAKLDIYHGELEGLMIAEVDFTDIYDADMFLKPHWFGLDVTKDKRFKNKNLAMLNLEKKEALVKRFPY